MNQLSRPRRIIGWILVGLVAAVMILAGVGGQFHTPTAEEIKKMGGLHDFTRILGIVQAVSGLLILIPRTSSLGILLTTAFWGGAICTHIVQSEPAMSLPAAVLMAMLWIGAYLKDPRFLASFHPQQG